MRHHEKAPATLNLSQLGLGSNSLSVRFRVRVGVRVRHKGREALRELENWGNCEPTRGHNLKPYPNLRSLQTREIPSPERPGVTVLGLYLWASPPP